MKSIALVAGLALFIVPLRAKEAEDVKVTPLQSLTATSSGQPIVLPQKDAQIVVSLYDIAPGAALPEHKHSYPRYGYVLAGILRVTNTEIGRSDVYTRGDFFAEAVGQWHFGATVGDEPLKLLVIDIVERDQPITVLRK